MGTGEAVSDGNGVALVAPNPGLTVSVGRGELVVEGVEDGGTAVVGGGVSDGSSVMVPVGSGVADGSRVAVAVAVGSGVAVSGTGVRVAAAVSVGSGVSVGGGVSVEVGSAGGQIASKETSGGGLPGPQVQPSTEPDWTVQALKPIWE